MTWLVHEGEVYATTGSELELTQVGARQKISAKREEKPSFSKKPGFFCTHS